MGPFIVCPSVFSLFVACFVLKTYVLITVIKLPEICSLFTALHGIQTRASDENSVCPSVRLSVKRVICNKRKESCDRIDIPHERPFTLLL